MRDNGPVPEDLYSIRVTEISYFNLPDADQCR